VVRGDGVGADLSGAGERVVIQAANERQRVRVILARPAIAGSGPLRNFAKVEVTKVKRKAPVF
jgi:hypothetical protein